MNGGEENYDGCCQGHSFPDHPRSLRWHYPDQVGSGSPTHSGGVLSLAAPSSPSEYRCVAERDDRSLQAQSRPLSLAPGPSSCWQMATNPVLRCRQAHRPAEQLTLTAAASTDHLDASSTANYSQAAAKVQCRLLVALVSLGSLPTMTASVAWVCLPVAAVANRPR